MPWCASIPKVFSHLDGDRATSGLGQELPRQGDAPAAPHGWALHWAVGALGSRGPARQRPGLARHCATVDELQDLSTSCKRDARQHLHTHSLSPLPCGCCCPPRQAYIPARPTAHGPCTLCTHAALFYTTPPFSPCVGPEAPCMHAHACTSSLVSPTTAPSPPGPQEPIATAPQLAPEMGSCSKPPALAAGAGATQRSYATASTCRATPLQPGTAAASDGSWIPPEPCCESRATPLRSTDQLRTAPGAEDRPRGLCPEQRWTPAPRCTDSQEPGCKGVREVGHASRGAGPDAFQPDPLPRRVDVHDLRAGWRSAPEPCSPRGHSTEQRVAGHRGACPAAAPPSQPAQTTRTPAVTRHQCSGCPMPPPGLGGLSPLQPAGLLQPRPRREAVPGPGCGELRQAPECVTPSTSDRDAGRCHPHPPIPWAQPPPPLGRTKSCPEHPCPCALCPVAGPPREGHWEALGSHQEVKAPPPQPARQHLCRQPPRCWRAADNYLSPPPSCVREEAIKQESGQAQLL